MKIKIRNYTIRTHDSKQYVVERTVERKIESQMIADSMNKADDSWNFGEHRIENDWRVGDTYEAEEFVGYFGELYPACSRVLEHLIRDQIGQQNLPRLMEYIKEAKEEIKDAIGK